MMRDAHDVGFENPCKVYACSAWQCRSSTSKAISSSSPLWCMDGRLRLFTRPSFIVPLYDSLNFYLHKLDIKLLGYVFMPDHIHLGLWPSQASNVTDFMRD